MGADGPDCHFHQHSAGGDFYESSGLFLAARRNRKDSLAARFGHCDCIFAEPDRKLCRPSPPADPQKAGHEGRKGR